MSWGSGPALPWGPGHLGYSGTWGQEGTNHRSNNGAIDVYDNLPFRSHLPDCLAQEKRPKCLYSCCACMHFFPHTSSVEIFHSLQQEPQAQQFKKGVFLRCWGVHYTLRGLILQVQAMMWHSLLQEAEGATPPHMDWGPERHPLATEIPIPLQKSDCKALKMCQGFEGTNEP